MGANAAIRQSFFTALTETSATDKEGVGTLRMDQFGNTYRWVQNVNAAAMTVGMVVSHDLTDTSTFFQKVDLGVTVDLSAMAGVVMAASLAASYYGWIQCLGYNASALVSNANYSVSLAVGDYLKPVDTVGYAVRDLATQPGYRRNLQILEVIASVTQTTLVAVVAAKSVLVNCM